MVSWSTIQSLLLFFGPVLLPRLLAAYRSLRAGPAAPPKPLPTRTAYALAVLFLSGAVAFLSTLPVFAPENVFRLTQSRLQTPAGVILSRLAAARPITPVDEVLRSKFDDGGLDARLLYARYGPSVLVECPFANPGDLEAGRAYFFYAVPAMLAPHALHLVALGVATSALLSGKEGARWRTIATIAGLVLGAAEVYFVFSYDDTYNQRSTRVGEIDFVHWKIQVWRGLLIAAVDGVLGWVIWLQATNRAFLTPLSTAERLLDHGKVLEAVLNKVHGIGVVKNAAMRDAGMRRNVNDYWVKEGEVMKDVFEQPEVLEAQRGALRRMDVTKVGREAESYVEAVIGSPQIVTANGLPAG